MAFIKKKIIYWSFVILYCFLVLSIGQVCLYKFVNPPMTNHMAYKVIQKKICNTLYSKPNYEWRDMKAISAHIQKAVLASEDQRFFDHYGFDFIELENAIRSYVETHYVRGASTISMQTARTVFLWPDRSLLRKALEAYYTVLIEISWGKERILEMYLNTVDWGPGVVGIEAASKRYFSIHANELNSEQASLMASILPRPHKWSPVSPDDHVIYRQKKIIKAMKQMPLAD